MSSINLAIARGLPAIDPAGEYAKLSDLALEAQQKRLDIQQQQQLLPVKLQAAQQLAQENALKLRETQADQQDAQTIQTISADPALGGDPDKIATALVGKLQRPKNYWDYRTNLIKTHKDNTDQATSEATLADTHTKHVSNLAYGALHNGTPMAFGGYLTHAVQDGSMTKSEADDIEQQRQQAPDPAAWANTHLLGKLTPADRKLYDDNLAATTKQDTEKRAADRAQAVDESYGLQNDADVAAWKKKHPQYATIIGDSFKPDTPGVIRLRLAVPVKDQPTYEQAQATTAADAAVTPEGWTKLITAAVGPDRVPAVQALVDAEKNPTKKRAIIEKFAEQKPAAEDSLAREATNILAKPVGQRTPEEKARLAAIQQQATMNRPAPGGVTLMIPNAEGGYTAQRVTPGQTVGPGAVTTTGMNTLNVPTSQMRNVGAQAQTVHEQMPNVLADIDRMKDRIGKVSGRWNEFMQGKVGMDDPDFAALRADLLMMSSAVALMHARGRLPENLRKEFETAINAPQQSADNLKAILSTIDRWTVANMNTMSGGKTAAAPEPAAGGGKKGDPLGIR